MKSELAESILQDAMKHWDVGKLSEEIKDIQIISEIKYDDYQQYTHGMRYIESLALWLRQFETEEERDVAYNFIKEKMIYISEEEMRQLVDYAYPVIIKDYLLEKTKEFCMNKKIVDPNKKREVFKFLRRSALFLGLSDGAHIDFFRRQNPFLSNEQVFVHYDFSESKAEDMATELSKDLSMFDQKFHVYEDNAFHEIFLIDDFSASGLSYIRKDDNGWHGKIPKFYKQLQNVGYDNADISIHLVLYVSTDNAKEHIKKNVEDFFVDKPSVKMTVDTLQQIVPLDMNKEFDIESLLKKCYELAKQKNEVKYVDKHFKVGDTKYPYRGFSGCSLPLILYHNTPNNSFPILWYSGLHNALFPRVRRHKEA